MLKKLKEARKLPIKLLNKSKNYIETIKVVALYGMLAVALIAFPDAWLNRLTNNAITNMRFAVGRYFYILLIFMLLFSIILNQFVLNKGKIIKFEINLSKQKSIEEKLNKLAYYDTLTGLPNRSLFEKRCTALIKAKSKQPFALVYLDVDNFKNINDTLGHPAGDQFLIHISKIILNKIGHGAFAARMGGDEFAIVYRGIEDKSEVVNRLKELIESIRKPWSYENQEFYTSVSMGIVMYPEDGDDLSLLFRNSDIAMYAVKKKEKDNYFFYSEQLQIKNLNQITMINDLHRAIENSEFTLFYQPIIDLKSGKLTGVEALIRWIHPEKGIISPMEFIPLAEEVGLIHDIGRWTMETAFKQKKEWEDMGYPHLKMSINVSGKSLVQKGFINEIRNLLAKTNLKSDEIQLEITETVLIEKMNASKTVLEEISKMGILIALDDFGTGYSSLTYLKNLPIDVVKLDANFIKGVMEDKEDSVIVESVIKLTHDLDLQMVAEGIETDEQLALLKSNKCDYGQGYLFSRPVTWNVIEEMMA